MAGKKPSTTSRAGLGVDGLRPLLSAFNKLPKEINAKLRDASQEIANTEADRIQAAGRSDDAQSRLVAPTVRARRDRVPAIVAGGRKRLSAQGGRPRAMDIFFGAEYGGGKRKTTQQFRPHRGGQGHWFWPTIRRDREQIIDTWMEAVDEVLDTVGDSTP